MGTWTDLVDKVAGALVSNSLWNQVAGAAGNVMGIKNDIAFCNLLHNGDFGRRNIFQLALPENFPDTNGYGLGFGSGTAPTVSGNNLTFGASTNIISWPRSETGSSTYFRDGRWSVTFKAVSTTGDYQLCFRFNSGSNYVTARMQNGNFELRKTISGTPTVVATVAQALTIDRWYWLEIEAQGTTFIVKIYDTGLTANSTLKSSSTLLQTLTGTVSDSSVASGCGAFLSNQPTVQVGGGVTSSGGGSYFETWLPESFTPTFSGLSSGQCVSYVETADSGPLGKQWALRFFYPKADRRIDFLQMTPDGSAIPSIPYAPSYYLRRIGITGTGTVATVRASLRNSAGTDQQNSDSTWTDTSSTSWTRIAALLSGHANARRLGWRIIGQDGTGTWTNATFDLMCLQFEQATTATVWRHHEADFEDIVFILAKGGTVNITTTSGSTVEVETRDLAGNLLIPWDATLHVMSQWVWQNSGTGNFVHSGFQVDGVGIPQAANAAFGAQAPTADYYMNHSPYAMTRVSAGKHRIAATWLTSAGTARIILDGNKRADLTVIAKRGK